MNSRKQHGGSSGKDSNRQPSRKKNDKTDNTKGRTKRKVKKAKVLPYLDKDKNKLYKLGQNYKDRGSRGNLDLNQFEYENAESTNNSSNVDNNSNNGNITESSNIINPEILPVREDLEDDGYETEEEDIDINPDVQPLQQSIVINPIQPVVRRKPRGTENIDLPAHERSRSASIMSKMNSRDDIMRHAFSNVRRHIDIDENENININENIDENVNRKRSEEEDPLLAIESSNEESMNLDDIHDDAIQAIQSDIEARSKHQREPGDKNEIDNDDEDDDLSANRDSDQESGAQQENISDRRDEEKELKDNKEQESEPERDAQNEKDEKDEQLKEMPTARNGSSVASAVSKEEDIKMKEGDIRSRKSRSRSGDKDKSKDLIRRNLDRGLVGRRRRSLRRRQDNQQNNHENEENGEVQLSDQQQQTSLVQERSENVAREQQNQMTVDNQNNVQREPVGKDQQISQNVDENEQDNENDINNNSENDENVNINEENDQRGQRIGTGVKRRLENDDENSKCSYNIHDTRDEWLRRVPSNSEKVLDLMALTDEELIIFKAGYRRCLSDLAGFGVPIPGNFVLRQFDGSKRRRRIGSSIQQGERSFISNIDNNNSNINISQFGSNINEANAQEEISLNRFDGSRPSIRMPFNQSRLHHIRPSQRTQRIFPHQSLQSQNIQSQNTYIEDGDWDHNGSFGNRGDKSKDKSKSKSKSKSHSHTLSISGNSDKSKRNGMSQTSQRNTQQNKNNNDVDNDDINVNENVDENENENINQQQSYHQSQQTHQHQQFQQEPAAPQGQGNGTVPPQAQRSPRKGAQPGSHEGENGNDEAQREQERAERERERARRREQREQRENEEADKRERQRQKQREKEQREKDKREEKKEKDDAKGNGGGDPDSSDDDDDSSDDSDDDDDESRRKKRRKRRKLKRKRERQDLNKIVGSINNLAKAIQTDKPKPVSNKEKLKFEREKAMYVASAKLTQNQRLKFDATFSGEGKNVVLDTIKHKRLIEDFIRRTGIRQDSKQDCKDNLPRLINTLTGLAKRIWIDTENKEFSSIQQWVVKWLLKHFPIDRAYEMQYAKLRKWVVPNNATLLNCTDSYEILKKDFDNSKIYANEQDRDKYSLTERQHVANILLGLNIYWKRDIEYRMKNKEELSFSTIQRLKDNFLKPIHKLRNQTRSVFTYDNDTRPRPRNYDRGFERRNTTQPRESYKPPQRNRKPVIGKPIKEKKNVNTINKRNSNKKPGKSNKPFKPIKEGRNKNWLNDEERDKYLNGSIDDIFKNGICNNCKLGGHFEIACRLLRAKRPGDVKRMDNKYKNIRNRKGGKNDKRNFKGDYSRRKNDRYGKGGKFRNKGKRSVNSITTSTKEENSKEDKDEDYDGNSETEKDNAQEASRIVSILNRRHSVGSKIDKRQQRSFTTKRKKSR